MVRPMFHVATVHGERPIPRLIHAAALACLTLGSSGCASMFNRTSIDARPPAEKPTTPELTSSERAIRYDDAFRQGVRLASRGKYGLALGAFEEAASMEPGSSDAWFNIAACHEQLGDPYRAITMYKRLMASKGGEPDPECYANIGTCCIKLFHRERNPNWRSLAIDAWKASLEIRPGQPMIQRYLAAAVSEMDE